MDYQTQLEIEQFLYQVSEACDNQDWDLYLSFFTDESIFHIPQWKSEHEYTKDPTKEMSLMYYGNRGGLEDRVFRIRTGKSAASTPMPRTVHNINNVRYQQEGDLFKVNVNWSTNYYRFGQTGLFFGYAYYDLVKGDQGFKIAYKQVILLNDKIDSVLDFYHV
ncbi:anthranilate 1,2-dioxygenase small subunit [Ignatzschineria rhizosphaerae]|uniref:anthranilate 1,2-dioxygenase small subunit n=1 Tax=Ignatzschineria rhizosphaerae TaxID=2923279 RepID=UPI003D815C7B